MAVAGIVGAYLSRADALLVDGLYSGINFVSVIVAARVGVTVLRPADRRYPFGYAAYEAIYVNYRGLLLVGIMTFAVFAAIQKIISYVTGGEVPDLVLGPILVYSLVMVAICMGLAAWHNHNFRQSGHKSELLKTESRAAFIDGVISAGAGGGLLASGLLRGTTLDFVTPVADSIVVLIMTAFIAHEPVRIFIGSLREVAGESADPRTIELLRNRIEESLDDRPYTLLEVTVTKLGRSHFAVSYVKPDQPITGEEADALWKEIDSTCSEVLEGTKVELIIAAQGPFE